jgi:hypothetical protein
MVEQRCHRRILAAWNAAHCFSDAAAGAPDLSGRRPRFCPEFQATRPRGLSLGQLPSNHEQVGFVLT